MVAVVAVVAAVGIIVLCDARAPVLWIKKTPRWFYPPIMIS